MKKLNTPVERKEEREAASAWYSSGLLGAPFFFPDGMFFVGFRYGRPGAGVSGVDVFDNLDPGDYKVEFVLPGGYKFTQ